MLFASPKPKSWQVEVSIFSRRRLLNGFLKPCHRHELVPGEFLRFPRPQIWILPEFLSYKDEVDMGEHAIVIGLVNDIEEFESLR